MLYSALLVVDGCVIKPLLHCMFLLFYFAVPSKYTDVTDEGKGKLI